MNNYFSEDFQYNSCIARGICTISPKNSALQTVVVLYLRIFAKFLVKISSKEKIEDEIKTFMLNILASAIFNPEFDETTFAFINKKSRQEFPKVFDKYMEYFLDEEMEPERKKVFELFDETSNMISAIKYGERIFRRSQEKISAEIRDLYNIFLVIAKSLSITQLELMSFEKSYEEGFSAILELLDKINIEEKDIKGLKNLIEKCSIVDVVSLEKLREAQEERYGIQVEAKVSFSTKPGKAVLVVGSNIRELEDVLENLNDFDIDVYTHDDMMLAHTFPKFSEYKNLRGQYGQGVESCLLDFATFPGPIILTKHSLHNIENFYRGRLFTTDYTSPKGVIKISNDDFSEVIKSANAAKGFKTGKECETVMIGFDFESTVNEIVEKINSKNYKRIFFIGLDNYSLEHKSYFEKLIRRTPDDTLIISFSYNSNRENLVYINTCFDSYSLNRIYDYIKEFELPIVVFVPRCNKDSISQMIYFKQRKNTQVFVGKCIPIILNPSLMITLEKMFGIKSISLVKNDLEKILHS